MFRELRLIDPEAPEKAGACTPDQTTASSHSARPDEPIVVHARSYRQCQDSPASLDSRHPHQPQADLQYLDILQDALNTPSSQQHGAPTSTPFSVMHEDGLAFRNQHWNKPPQLDDIDNEFLAKKGVFDLPPQHYLDSLLKAYFDYIYPFGPVIERVDFAQNYRSGKCSLLLLHAMSAAASLFVSDEIISGCGYRDRAAAQASFFMKAKLLHSFHCESDPLTMLQASVILSIVILDHPTDRDYQYWFYNCIRLAMKLDIHNICSRDDESCPSLKLFRRIWWVLWDRDVLHSFLNRKNMRLLDSTPLVRPITEDDWEDEDIPEGSEFLSPIPRRQKISFIAHCEAAQICRSTTVKLVRCLELTLVVVGRCLSALADEQLQDPRQLICPLDAWRLALTDKMGTRDPSYGGDICFYEALAMSYRFESIACRRLRRRRWHGEEDRDASWSEWTKQRLRSAIFELDTIVSRVLTNGTIHKFPISFITTIPALLAMHIESALDPSETEFVRSMAQISISQAMLVLDQLRGIPAIKRAFPVFETILSNKNLDSTLRNSSQQHTPPERNNSLEHEPVSPHAQASPVSAQVDPGQACFSGDLLEFDFLDQWQIEQLDFTGIC
ncbi:cutinase transcription factor 1 beta [Fusarium albosuccineum]|uniref:Cutinase transcription factor 1 beta n=1 Tax=Fusarium albosuccineum TaxID=1237068 RepID=A0A8H4LM79_9HYPO|nr:cutinase transcription factor 1 beta [Fusarium albosuccineum]